MRWFTKEFQFTTDAYRLHAALNRLCQGSNSWYSSGPSQKYVLRQIKAMDFALVREEDRGRYNLERASYIAKDDKGQTVINDDVDVCLLLLYAQMLYSGGSYAYSLSMSLRTCMTCSDRLLLTPPNQTTSFALMPPTPTIR